MKIPAHSWVEINGRNITRNLKAHKKLLSNKTKLMAIAKSNAYGHGLELVARTCERSGLVDWLGVVSLTEALTLRRLGLKSSILVLNYYHPLVVSELANGIAQRVSFMVYELGAIKALERASRQIGKQAHVHLELETGMARLGAQPKEAEELLKYILKSPYLLLEGLASHLATAESHDQTFLQSQLDIYNSFTKQFVNIIPDKIIKHLACSAAITTAVQTHFGLVRLGIGMYGLWPSAENKQVVKSAHPQFELYPSLTWKTQIIETQKLPIRTPIGYDCSYVTKRPTIMAVIPVGYWDGYDRKLSNSGYVLINGLRCPIMGRICMNVSMVDITEAGTVKVGDEVVLLGKQKTAEITVDELAQKIGTINYEVVTRINPQLPRVLV